MEAKWLRRPKAGNSVVFVHGFLSSGEACWRHANGKSWPEIILDEPDLESCGIYIFTYETGIFSGSYRVGDIVDSLKEHMRLDDVFDTNRLIFVCHSMGGIVVRKLIVERAPDFIETQKEIDIFLVASPSLGSSYGGWFSPLAKLLGHAQASVLRFVRDNDWLIDLDKEFMNLKEANTLKIKGKELVEDKFIVLPQIWRRQVVEPLSGARYFGEPFKVPKSDHFSIAKPADREAIQHRLLRQFVKEVIAMPNTHLEQIKGKQDMLPPQATGVLPGPLTIGAVLKGAEHQYIEEAYPTGDYGIHLVFSLFNANAFDFLVHRVLVDVLAYAPLNLDHLTHGAGATDVLRCFRATICPKLGSYVATYVSSERQGEYVTIPPGKSEGFDVEITAPTEGLYDVCLRVLGDSAGERFNVLLDSTKQQVVFFDKGAGYMVERHYGQKMLTYEKYIREMKRNQPLLNNY